MLHNCRALHECVVHFPSEAKHCWSNSCKWLQGNAQSFKSFTFMGWITAKLTGVKYQHAWSGGEQYLTDAKVWADACYESPRHKYVKVYMGCHFHGCQSCYDIGTMNTHLNKTMIDLYIDTEQWIHQVIACNYKV